MSTADPRPDVVILMTDQERAAPPYETDEVAAWRRETLVGARWFDEHAVNFRRHYTGSLACVPSRPTIFTGQYPDVHGVTQTNGLGKMEDDSRMRWLRPAEVPTLGHWFRAAGYDTHYDGKWHITHADLQIRSTSLVSQGGSDRSRTVATLLTPVCAGTHSLPTVSSRGCRTATPAVVPVTPTRCGRFCSWRAS